MAWRCPLHFWLADWLTLWRTCFWKNWGARVYSLERSPAVFLNPTKQHVATSYQRHRQAPCLRCGSLLLNLRTYELSDGLICWNSVDSIKLEQFFHDQIKLTRIRPPISVAYIKSHRCAEKSFKDNTSCWKIKKKQLYFFSFGYVSSGMVRLLACFERCTKFCTPNGGGGGVLGRLLLRN